MHKDSKIYVAGHKGLVGSAVFRKLTEDGFTNLVYRTREELDLMDTPKVEQFFWEEQPEYVFDCAARVGGIMANSTLPADFIMENLLVQNNLILASVHSKVKKFLFLGSSCIYPRMAPQPIKEEYFMTGQLEPTNIAYATAKIAGIVACQSYAKQYGSNFISVMPTNLYGANDNYDLHTSHVLPALLRRFHEAKINGNKTVTLWGTGSALREFLHVDDLADALVFLMENYDSPEIINIGSGQEVSIKELARYIQEVVQFDGTILWDKTKPDGMPRKLLDSSKLLSMGWKPMIDLAQGIQRTYEAYT